MSKPTEAERVAQLHAQAAADYGTPAERAARAAEASVQAVAAKAHAQQAAAAPRGRR